jgi:hypothetical protein
VSSPTFGASSLNQWKLGPTCEQHFVQFPENPETQNARCLVKTQ